MKQWDDFLLFNSSKKDDGIPNSCCSRYINLSPLESMQLLLIYFSTFFIFFVFLSAPFHPLAPAVIYLHSVSLSPPFSIPCPTTNTISSLSPATVHASQLWDIAFLILLTGDNIYVLFFNIHFSCLHRPRFGPGNKNTAQTHKLLFPLLPSPPLPFLTSVFLVCSLHFPLSSLPPTHYYCFFLSWRANKGIQTP